MDSLSICETAATFVEGVDKKSVEETKKEWKKALYGVKNDFKFKENIDVEYNPLIWHVSRYPVGIRVYCTIGGVLTVIEFSTPNRKIPFDIFLGFESKRGVLAHEIAHILDDRKWYPMDYQKIMRESKNHISREQRAELLAFLYDPLGIIYSNISLIKLALFLSGTRLEGQYIEAYAILETLGRIGMNRNINIPLFFKKMSKDQNIDVSKLLRHHITYPFCLAGSIGLPGRESVGITKTADLISCREKLISFLKGELNLSELNRKFKKMGYCTSTKKELMGNVKKILIPEILDASSLSKIKKAERYVSKLEFVELKNDMIDALKLCKTVLADGM